MSSPNSRQIRTKNAKHIGNMQFQFNQTNTHTGLPAYNPISLALPSAHACRLSSQPPLFGAEFEQSFTDDDEEGIEIAVRGENGQKRVAKQSKVLLQVPTV